MTPTETRPSPAVRRQALAAGVAALTACAVCCAGPVLAAAGLGSGALAAWAAWLHTSPALVGGAAMLALTCGGTALYRRARRYNACQSSSVRGSGCPSQ